MVFPATPRVIKVELFVVGLWIDITSDVYVRGGITISRGRKDEQSRAEPSSCQLVLDNRSGNYSPRNPVGAYYGYLGRNTPIRLNVQLARDTFSRTVSSGWGTNDTGQTYTLSGSGGSVLGTDVPVNSGVGKISLPAAGATRALTMSGLSLRDVDVSCDISLPFTDVTGDQVAFGIRLRQPVSTSNYVVARVNINTDESLSIRVFDNATGISIVPTTTIAGLTHSSAQTLSIRFAAEGQTFRAKVWATSTGEPYGWTVSGHAALPVLAGGVTFQGFVNASNTNALPVVFSVDNVTVRVPRFTGEVASWPQRWDITGTDVYVPIQAAGIKRRLGQGATPMRSPLYRHYTRLATPPVGYWSMEDSKNTASFASGVGGPSLTDQFTVVSSGASLQISTQAWVTYAGNSRYLGSNQLPVFPQISEIPAATPIPLSTSVTGSLATYTATGQTTIHFLLSIPFSTTTNTPETPDVIDIIQIRTTGTNWQIYYRTGGLIEVQNSVGYASGAINYGDVRGRDILYTLQLTESGADVNWNLALIDQNAATGLQLGATAPTVTVGRVTGLLLNGSSEIIDHTFGHVAVRSEAVSLFDVSPSLGGFITETAGTRMQRLGAEEGISFSYRGDITTTQRMGPQGAGAVTTGSVSTASLTSQSVSQTLLDLLYECEDVDGGTLYEARGDVGLAYRTRSDAYSQTATLTMDYTAGQVAPPLEPVDDDQSTRNNVVATRVNGGSVEAELTVGRMSTLPPSLGGIGAYDTQYTLNVASDSQLTDFATWLLAKGTPDEARYPNISINLANPNTVAAGLESSALAVDVDDLLVVTNPKTGVTPDSIRQLVRGYTETINVFTHIIKFNCAPESPYRVGTYDATPLFRYDTVTSTLVAGVSSSATTISVANIGEPWTTDPIQMPIPILISGELMNVTAVSGTSTPQTFTVVRAVNGVVKAQLAGAVVQIYPVNSATYAL